MSLTTARLSWALGKGGGFHPRTAPIDPEQPRRSPPTLGTPVPLTPVLRGGNYKERIASIRSRMLPPGRAPVSDAVYDLLDLIEDMLEGRVP